MKGTILFGALMASCMILSEATFVLPAITIGTGALAGIALVKLAAIKGALIGGLIARRGRRRGRRSLDDIESTLLSASQQDSSDCAKRLICEVSALPIEEIGSEEAMLTKLFNPDNLDISKATVEFDLAAQIGKRVGIKQCAIIYERCPHNRKQLVEIFRGTNFENEF